MFNFPLCEQILNCNFQSASLLTGSAFDTRLILYRFAIRKLYFSIKPLEDILIEALY